MDDVVSLSPRAREVLRRADAQVAAVRRRRRDLRAPAAPRETLQAAVSALAEVVVSGTGRDTIRGHR